jgi:sugar lactone lactonase YvrE
VATRNYSVAAIPSVIEAGKSWDEVWRQEGNVADGIIASDDGGLLVPRADRSDVIELTPGGQVTVRFRDTPGGVALSRNKQGALFIAQRLPTAAIWQLLPEHRLFADRFQDEPLDCLAGRLNDLVADTRGGVYFTMGGLFYADAKGAVTQYGTGLRTNGLILSPDETVLYVTNGDTLVAFDVRPDGSLANQRIFTSLPGGAGDGSTIDAAGRIYVTGGVEGVRVVAPDGRYLGTIPTPLGAMSVAFSGSTKKTLFVVSSILFAGRRGQVLSIPMVAHGYPGRAK